MAFDSDWVFLQAAVPALQDYLLSEYLYRPLLLPPTFLTQRPQPGVNLWQPAAAARLRAVCPCAGSCPSVRAGWLLPSHCPDPRRMASKLEP